MLETIYIEYIFSPLPEEADREVLVSELMVLGFDSFSEEGDVLRAYLPAFLQRNDLLQESSFIRRHPGVTVEVQALEDKNWNEEWEKNYPPVIIGGKCYVRAPFHEPRPDLPMEIVIEPKMSFGTAHHETTHLMAEWMLEISMKGKDVLDMGCGTGILAILANKSGASRVMGVDNDEWAYRNALENLRTNRVNNGEVVLGDASCLGEKTFDLVLANINRNVLTADMTHYAEVLKPGGMILFSGFLEADAAVILQSAGAAGLTHAGTKIRGAWAAMLFLKEK